MRVLEVCRMNTNRPGWSVIISYTESQAEGMGMSLEALQSNITAEIMHSDRAYLMNGTDVAIIINEPGAIYKARFKGGIVEEE